MKNTAKRLALFFLALTVFTSIAVPAFALSWDGSSEGGGGHGVPAGPNGYAIRTTAPTNLIGYRFSVVDRDGNNRVTKVIDVFRRDSNAPYGSYAYEHDLKYVPKYNKKQLIAHQNGSYSTEVNSTWCYKENEIGFASELPLPADLETWQNNTTNLNKVLAKIGIGSIENLNGGDKILMEQLYEVRLEGVYHALTVTETAIYGKHILGAYSDGGHSTTSESWGFISNYVNKHYPNALFTPDGQGLWPGATASDERIAFYYIINKGYGVGIAYTEEHEEFVPTLSVKECRTYKGVKPNKDFHYGTSTGNTWGNWTYVSDYPVKGDKIFFSVNFPKEDENTYVKQTVWVDGTKVGERVGYSDDLEWFDVSPTNTTVPAAKQYYEVKARVNWIDENGTVLLNGAEKLFYIPVKPVATREKVTAYNEAGEVQSFATASLTSGKLYFGQKVTFQYLYGATTSWESENNVTAKAQRWNGSAWANIYSGSGGLDVNETNVVLSSAKSYSRNSSIGEYVIPLNANTSTNSFKLRFDLTTAWSKDAAHTTEGSTFYLPVVKSDVAIIGMRLVDSNGVYADTDNLIVGDTYTVRYVYRNNTDCTVFVKGYNDDHSQIPGVYTIPAGETIEVVGGTHTVPDEREYSIWGGVYLSTVSMGNTDYETDGSNNARNFTCHTALPLDLTAVEPNAAYRESTDVISTFRVWNRTNADILPSDNISVRIRVFRKNVSRAFFTETKNVVVPANGSNIVYFKWTVPVGLNGSDVTVKADIYDGREYSNLVSDDRATTPYSIYTTPDTQYEENAPTGFAVPRVPSAANTGARWQEYEYDGKGGLRLKEYTVGIGLDSTNYIIPATGETEYFSDGCWHMKSGYGISVNSRILMELGDGRTQAKDYMFTLPQYAYMLFPEYSYIFGDGTAATLELLSNGKTDYFEFYTYLDYGRVHFTPLWYPDGDYFVQVVQSDCWTPAGMITRTITLPRIIIEGSAYDDWYVGQR